MSFFERYRFSSHLPEREPDPSDYDGVDRIEVVHLNPDAEGQNPREKKILGRIRKLRDQGIQVDQVDIDTPTRDGGKNVVVGGVIGDVCVEQRRGILRDRGNNAKVDTSLTSDY